MGASVLQVFVLRDGQLAASEVFAEGLYSLGSEPDCDLLLNGPGVSGVHALLQYQDGAVTLSDHDSESGILVNGARVNSATIRSSDDVRVGPFLLKTRVLGKRPPPIVAPRPAAPGLRSAPPPGPPAPAASAPPSPAPRPAAPQLRTVPSAASSAGRSGQDSATRATAQQQAPAKAQKPPPPPPIVLRPLAAPPASVVSRGTPITAPQTPVKPATPPLQMSSSHPLRGPESDIDDLDSLFDAALSPLGENGDLELISLDTPLELVPLDAPLELDLQRSPAPHAAPPRTPPRRAEPPPQLAPPPVQRTPAPPPVQRTPAPPTVQRIPAPPPVQRTPAPPPGQRTPAPPRAAPSLARSQSSGGLATVAKGALPAPDAVLYARVFWGDTLLVARSFDPLAPVFQTAADHEMLRLHGFADAPVIQPAGRSWNVATPQGTRLFERSGAGWVPAAPSGARELRLGKALRLQSGRFLLELEARTPAIRAGKGLLRKLEWGVFLLVAAIGIGFITFVKTLPPPPAQHPLEKELIRNVQLKIEERKPPKKEKKPKPIEQEKAAEKPPEKLQQATTLKAAAAPMRAIDRVVKATRGISSLLASLEAVAPKGGARNALAMIPTLGRMPAPLPGLGGPGGTGGLGPVTKGGELLRGGSAVGVLGGASGGKGTVVGVPVSVPSRPSKVQGSIDREAVAKVINEHVNEMRSCYERAMLHDPNLGAGKVALEWTIDPTGAVAQVRITTATLKSSEVSSCLLDLLRGLQFPKPNGGVVIVTYPVLFNSVGY